MVDRSEINGDVSALYKILISYQVYAFHTQKTKIGLKGKCRFCGEGNLKKFKTEAHTLAEFLGNKSLISLDECDNCNKKFASYENELSRFLSPYLTLAKVKGKNKVPKFKHSGLEIERDSKRGVKFSISNENSQNLVSYNHKTDTFNLTAPLPNFTFVPRYAYKALCKMALSVMPQEELSNYQKLCDWILEPDDLEDFPFLECKIAQTNLVQHLPYIGVYLLKRKAPETPVPYIIFILMASTFCLQIDLMSDEKEDHIDFLELGQIKISKNAIIGEGEKQIHIHYSDETVMNWADREKTQILLKDIKFSIPRTGTKITLKTTEPLNFAEL